MSVLLSAPFQTPLRSCAEPNLIKFDAGATLERPMIHTAFSRQTKLRLLAGRSLGTNLITFALKFKMVDEVQRLARVRAIIVQGNPRRRMLSQATMIYNTYRRRRLAVLLSLVGLLLLSRHQNNATERVY